MTRFLVDCELETMELHIPREHVEGLVAWFDGQHDGERGAATASASGQELRFEGRGGRLTLRLSGTSYAARDLEVADDREGEFLETVVVNLFRAYRGTLGCRVRWGAKPGARPGDWLEVRVERGRSSWPSGPVGRWLAGPGEAEAEEGGEQSPESVEALEEILAKLEEAERHFSEYLRLKQQRSVAKG